MKNKNIFLLFLIIGLSYNFALAQNGINYKALIKDNLGDVVANQTIDVKFTIIADTGPTNVYTETHTGTTTDAKGVVVLNIGNGTTSDVFTTIDWSSDIHSLKIEIDIEQDGTFIDMGTTQFMAVPYAMHAKSSTFDTKNNITSNSPGNITTDNFVFGSNQLNDVSGTDDNSKMFFNKTKGAFRAGNTGTQWDDENVGEKSVAFGIETKASAEASTALGSGTQATATSATSMGFGTIASGEMSLATGHETNASGFASLSSGEATIASGNYATTLGIETKAESFASVSLGSHNIGGGNPTSWVETDPLLEIGNGESGNPSNALTVLKNGSVGIGEATPAQKLEVDGKIKLGDDTLNPTEGSMRYNQNTKDFEGFDGETYKPFNTTTVTIAHSNTSSTSSSIRNDWVITDTVTITEAGTYLILFKCSFQAITGNLITLPYDRFIDIDLARESTNGVIFSIDNNLSGPQFIQVSGNTSAKWRNYEHLSNFTIQYLGEGQNLLLRTKVTSSQSDNPRTETYWVNDSEIYAIKLN